MRRFNVTGLCVPDKHYMVDISDKLAKIMEMIDNGDYFTINRARQYGKTTTLLMLARALPKEYTCISLSFEGVGDTMFENSASFCQFFLLHVSKTLEKTDKSFAALWKDETVTDFYLLGYHIDELCKDRKIVLMIDEVDKTSSNQVFLHFLGILRSKYLANQAGAANTFHSVILAGVYDIRNIKLKMITEGAYTPWVEFDGKRIFDIVVCASG
ncbi:MAG: AAA-like domain-containing protein [Oscillospiraceae bacterium]|nr:AAA-like domain-containing protein [Oscillospiraceae bacterium]